MTLTHSLLRSLLVLASLTLISCASVKSTVAPGKSTTDIKSIYVEHNPEEDRDIDKMIASQLRSRGYRATHGSAAAKPSGVDAVLRYDDQWMWDITMYLLQLDLKLHESGSNQLVSEASSYRPSLQRKSTDAMVKETLDALLPK
jgi:hypothetical protein